MKVENPTMWKSWVEMRRIASERRPDVNQGMFEISAPNQFHTKVFISTGTERSESEPVASSSGISEKL